MESPSEWCDHIVLKAAVDVLALRTIVFNVYGNDVLRTEILPANCTNSSDMMTIYLGHLGEFHYLSLRPNKWDREWQKSNHSLYTGNFSANVISLNPNTFTSKTNIYLVDRSIFND